MVPRLLTLVLVLALAVTAGVSRSALDVISDDASNDLLYLPNGKHLKILSLGHETLLADMIFLWAIQYYSNYEREDRYRYVEHVFGEVITELVRQW